MRILSTKGWKDYELLDSGAGSRLERFGDYVISRPDPQCIWKKSLDESAWEAADAVFDKGSIHDKWIKRRDIPEKWRIEQGDLVFFARLTPFKHTGIFPEQILNWDWMREKIREEKKENKKEIRILNLFGYTGIASVACAKEGAQVTHVDASKPSIAWARENQDASGLSETSIRWILDDALKFCEREVRRGNIYDAVIMDPPVYGHGPGGERWDFFDFFPKLLDVCFSLLSARPIFFLVNAYAISASSLMLENIVADRLKVFGGEMESGELALQEAVSNRLLSTGIYLRWSR